MKANKSMYLYWFSIALAVLANLFYHAIQKQTPALASPALTLTMTYLTAGVVCFIAYLLFPGREGFFGGFRHLNWTAAALGVAIIGLELGFLLAYRTGWNVNSAALLVNTAVSVLLVPVGLMLFKEGIKPINIVGIALCIAGLVCMTRR